MAQSLVKMRGSIKQKQTIFNRFMNEYFSSFDTKSPDFSYCKLDKKKIIEFESRFTRYENILEEFDEIQLKIESECEGAELQKCFDERVDFENMYFETLGTCKEFLNAYHEEINNRMQNFDNANNSVVASTASSIQGVHQSNLKFPEIKLPTFSGDYSTWLEYRDTFDSLVNKNIVLDDIQKFHYLRSSLEGGAAQIIFSLEFSEANYKVAWETLLERYNNESVLVYNHVKSIFELPIINQESVVELRKMLDVISRHLRALNGLGQPTDSWDTLLIYLLSQKLDKRTAREWEEKRIRLSRKTVNSNEQSVLPDFNEFKLFLQQKADFLETVALTTDQRVNKSKPTVSHATYHSVETGITGTSYQKTKVNCVYCKEADHFIQNCSKFLKLSTNDKISKVKALKLCTNCLRGNHFSKFCFAGNCRKCQGKHNTLLHFDNNKPNKSETKNINESQSTILTSNVATTTIETASDATVCSISKVSAENYVLLSTALVEVLDKKGQPHVFRALLDCASQSNFISEECCKILNLDTKSTDISVIGINQGATPINKMCSTIIKSLRTTFQVNLSFLVLPIINESIPNQPINTSALNIPNHLGLADPNFNTIDKIDILLGASIYYNLLCAGQVHLSPEGYPIMQKTVLGWIISGPIPLCPSTQTVCKLASNKNISNDELQEQLKSFWEIEEPSSKVLIVSREDEACEEIFQKTTQRDVDGRFIVQIPLKNSISLLGESKKTALSRLNSLEYKLKKQPELAKLYTEFMKEYQSVGHMTPRSNHDDKSIVYFMPHHGVLNEHNQTTRLRVVFDASAQTTSGTSFNDLQYVGPTIQEDLLAILLRFRQNAIVVCADIVKMFRQIWIDPSQRSLQTILWRQSPQEEPTEYLLNTVRCLHQLALEHKDIYPKASDTILKDFYMDDLLTGGNDETEVIRTCDEIITILKSGCFDLQKWASNNSKILEHVQASNPSTILKIGDGSKTKTLGLFWSCSTDSLLYNVSTSPAKSINKRSILSDISQIFDPLGLVGPCIILGKIIMQRLWASKVTWDETLPQELDTRWKNFRNQLQHLNNVNIPRFITTPNTLDIQLHGFADASIEAYGACVYVRSTDANGIVTVNLLFAKTRVAPLKSLTIPRLELCGALLLTQLIAKIKNSMNLSYSKIYLWSDSSICLAWIKTEPNLLQTFVQNRVSQIRDSTNPSDWHHIKSADNPADCLSRGVNPMELSQLDIWWYGPCWLKKEESLWPQSCIAFKGELPEVKKKSFTYLNVQLDDPFSMINYSTFKRLQRVAAWSIRFLRNARRSLPNRDLDSLSATELDSATQYLIKISQRESFGKEIVLLANKNPLPNRSKLMSLTPFLDEAGILRVGGRLQHSSLSFQRKHPAVLSDKHHLTKLLFTYEHTKMFHLGPQHLLYRIRERFWPLRGRNIARQTVHKCIRCFRAKPTTASPIMGSLPSTRVCPAPPFHRTGVDFAGPIKIKDKLGRGAKITKAYLCLFICFTTKCIHLEAVSNLTTEAFLAAFRRFVSRRGKPFEMFSDNGTNFVGANTELRELSQFLQKNETKLEEEIYNSGVNWKFIPAYSPHMGGYWEAGIKSAKTHLKKVAYNVNFTFEELCTVLTEIECILNSRPISPMSSDPNDFTALTPSHFLIGRSFSSLPDPDVTELPANRLSRFQLMQQIQQHFWKRWSREFLSEMQTRSKWQKNLSTITVGSLVLLRDDNAPPLRWPLGRIQKLFVGADGIPRVADVITSSGVTRRALAQLCKLPVDDNELPT